MRRPFESAVAEHGPAVLRACRALLSPADADDAWSEAFLAALRAWPDLDDDANVRAWLITIAHRKSVDLLRAQNRRATPVAQLPEGASRRGLPGEDGGAARVHAALARLPDKQRRAVAYHHLAGLPHADVAALLGGSPAAARRASADGIAALRRLLAPEEGPPR